MLKSFVYEIYALKYSAVYIKHNGAINPRIIPNSSSLLNECRVHGTTNHSKSQYLEA